MNTTLRVYVFGNPDIAMDSLPLRLLPALRAAYPDWSLETLDPNEEWDIPEHMVIIDTVVGISEVTVFHDLNAFVKAPRMTCHDFDAYANLLPMKKLGKLKGVTIIGIPPHMEEGAALAAVCKVFADELPTLELKKLLGG